MDDKKTSRNVKTNKIPVRNNVQLYHSLENYNICLLVSVFLCFHSLFLNDYARWKIIFEESITYLITLKTKAGPPPPLTLITHRRKTFLIGFIIAALGIKQLSYGLLTRQEHPFKYVLTYKLSQDNLKLLFACIPGKSGFNSNSDSA